MANELYLFTGLANPNDVKLRSGVSGPTAYALTGQVRALTLTGQAATMGVGRALTGQVRALTLTGQSATVVRAYPLTAQVRALTLTGQAATVAVARNTTAQVRALSLTGQSATLTATVAPVAYALTGQVAPLTLAAQTADATVTAVPAAPTGSIVGSYQGHARRIEDVRATPYNWPAPKLPDETETVEPSPAPTPDVAPEVPDTPAPLTPIGISMPKDEWLVPYAMTPNLSEPVVIPSALASLPTLTMGQQEPPMDDGAELAMALALIAVDDF